MGPYTEYLINIVCSRLCPRGLLGGFTREEPPFRVGLANGIDHILKSLLAVDGFSFGIILSELL